MPPVEPWCTAQPPSRQATRVSLIDRGSPLPYVFRFRNRSGRACDLQRSSKTIRRAVTRHGLFNARVFGSVLHGADEEGSDLDLLVDAGAETSLLGLVRAKHEIEDALGLTVDLLTPEDLPVSFRDRVLAEARPL